MKRTRNILVLLFLMIWSASSYAQMASKDDGRFSFPTLAEETKLARDVYNALEDKWGQQIFTNFRQAKEKQLQEIKKLMNQRGLELPESIVEDEHGFFTDPPLQKWYTNLVAEGSTSLEAALKVGAMIGESEITSLQAGLEVEIDEKETTLLKNLLNASHNHLRALHKNLEKQGVNYQPTIMDQAAFNSVIQADKTMNCQGGGQMGKGKMGGCKGKCCKSSE